MARRVRFNKMTPNPRKVELLLYLYVTSSSGTHIMSNATLRAVGGSIVVALPKPSLEQLNLRPGSRVRVEVERGKVTLTPIAKPRYTLAQLLAKCDFTRKTSRDERAWESAKPIGKEII
jgi:antitoxin ChpS